MLLNRRRIAKERIDSAGGIESAPGVATERIDSVRGVAVARGVAKERTDPAGGIVVASSVIKRSACTPLAVLRLPRCC